jgi:hypothetical protein
MRVTKGKVVNGNIVVEGESLPEGSSVTVLVTDEDGFTLTEEEENLLLEAMAEADRGEFISAEDVLKRIP